MSIAILRPSNAITLTLLLGLMAMPRSPFKVPEDSDEASEEGGVVDASLLPPG